MPSTRIVAIVATMFIASLLAQAAWPQDQQNAPSSPCAGDIWWADSNATWSDFDFWVGEWLVVDRASGKLMGFDQVEKVNGGCALSQRWHQMNDRFAVPGSPRRLSGGSRTSLGVDGRWHQIWMDNNGSWIPVAGGLEPDGTMRLESEWQEFTNRQGQPVRLKYRWQWKPLADGTIHNWGEVGVPEDSRVSKDSGASKDSGDSGSIQWQKSFDILYQRNERGGPTLRLDSGAGPP